jgi:uncharacterized phage-associated protein
MENLKLAYCNECEDLVEFDIYEELIEEEFKGETISYKFRVGKCKCCNREVATDIDYNSRKSKAKIEAYKRKIGIIDLNEISEILDKYNIGKENLADIAGFGKVTIKRYYDGFIPSREYSETLFRILHDEEYFMGLVEDNKEKLKDVAYRKIISRYERLAEISSSKIDQIANYIITHIGEVTPLALQKLLSFSNGVNYALNGKQLIFEESQAWAHGPVYPQMYNKYKRFGYKPIDDGIYSTHGCMLSKLSAEEIKAIDLVICTFGLYSPKTLERISHSQEPWKEKRIGYKEDEAGREVIEEASIKRFYTNQELNSEESIIKYIMSCIKNSQ